MKSDRKLKHLLQGRGQSSLDVMDVKEHLRNAFVSDSAKFRLKMIVGEDPKMPLHRFEEFEERYRSLFEKTPDHRPREDNHIL